MLASGTHTVFIEINKHLNGYVNPAAAPHERPKATTPTVCPECGSEIYDNRTENAERKSKGLKPRPVFKCKSCGWVQWRLPKGNG